VRASQSAFNLLPPYRNSMAARRPSWLKSRVRAGPGMRWSRARSVLSLPLRRVKISRNPQKIRQIMPIWSKHAREHARVVTRFARSV